MEKNITLSIRCNAAGPYAGRHRCAAATRQNIQHHMTDRNAIRLLAAQARRNKSARCSAMIGRAAVIAGIKDLIAQTGLSCHRHAP